MGRVADRCLSVVFPYGIGEFLLYQAGWLRPYVEFIRLGQVGFGYEFVSPFWAGFFVDSNDVSVGSLIQACSVFVALDPPLVYSLLLAADSTSTLGCPLPLVPWSPIW